MPNDEASTSAGQPRVFSRGHVAAIAAMYALAGVLLWSQVGPWEAVRRAVANGLLALAWLAAAGAILRPVPLPAAGRPRRPALELALLLAALAAMMTIAAVGFLDLAEVPAALYYLVSVGVVLAVHFGFGGRWRELGLRLGPGRGWLALAAVVGLNVAFAVVFQLLPRGEAVDPPGSDLAEELTGPLSVLLLIGALLVRAALPEEMVLRVGLQPRLAAFVGVGWAIVLQAGLFSLGHLPQQMAGYDRSLLLALGYVLPIENGLIAGYLWHRTRSLPLLLVLHVLAFPRFGI